jgi:uncharacterized protein (DUF58 family)
LRSVLTFIPQRRLLGLLLVGAGLVALASLTWVVWLAVVLYHAFLVSLAWRDASRLPPAEAFKARREVPQPFSLGQLEEVTIGIACTAAAGLDAEIADHAPLQLSPRPRVLRSRFDENGRLAVSYQTRPPHRGAFEFGPIDVRLSRPGSLFVRQLRMAAAEEVAVFPDLLAIKRYQLTLRRGARMYAGQRRARPPGASTAFAALRDYVPGDDVRRISWKATARRDRPVTAEYEAERGQQVIVALDCGRLMTAPAGHLIKLDHAVNAALLLAWVAQSQGDRVGLMTFSDRVLDYVGPKRGSRQISLFSQVLYDVGAEYTEPDFASAFGYLGRRAGRRSLIVVLTDVLDPESSRELVSHALRLGRRHLVLVVAMADPDLLAARDRPVDRASRAYEWAAAEELLAARRESFETLQRGGALALDVPADRLSPAVVERYLELKERGLL